MMLPRAAPVLAPVAALAACLLATPSRAAEPPRPGAVRAVPGACQAEIARYCIAPGSEAPAGDDATQTMGGRSAVICLRPYSMSLSLGCRRAVTATSGQ